MKKILNLLILTIFTAPLLNLTKANLNLYIQKRQTTSNTVPSLQEMITTINIGQIETNDQEDIIQGLQQAQNLNPATNLIREFLLTQNNNNNLEFENINHTTARIHLRNTQQWNTIYISRLITFTINFLTNRFILSSIITNNNLGYIENNSIYTILRILQNNYPLITQLNIDLNVSNITTNSARISYSLENNFRDPRNNYVDINFQANHLTLNTINLNTNLGELQDNSPSTILSTFLNLNNNNPNLNLQEQMPTVHLITATDAIISTRIRRECWIPANYYIRPITIEEEQDDYLIYALVPDTIRVTFTLQNNNQNETQISRPDTNSNDNNIFNYCSANINSNLQNLQQKNNKDTEDIKKYCNPVNDITGKILKPNDIYFGTNGIYLKIDKEFYKTNNFNPSILDIKFNNQNNAYIVTNKKEIYHLNLNNWNLTKIPNIESNNLTKEIKLFYNQKKENWEIEHNWWNKPSNYTIHDFNLGDINPFDYQKIEFLGDDKDFYSKISWGNTAYYGKKLNEFNYTNFKNHLTECHVVKTTDGVDNCGGGQIKEFVIQNIKNSYLLAHISGYQDLSLTWYKKNNNYHLQVLVDQGVDTTGSTSGGSVWLNLGKGIRLYNN